jgi:hypothetical protein
MKRQHPLDPEAATGRVLDAQLHLLDRQVHDIASVPVTAVSDLEISDVDGIENIPPGTPAPQIVALLSVVGRRRSRRRDPARRQG